jgi:hypothetical protein
VDVRIDAFDVLLNIDPLDYSVDVDCVDDPRGDFMATDCNTPLASLIKRPRTPRAAAQGNVGRVTVVPSFYSCSWNPPGCELQLPTASPIRPAGPTMVTEVQVRVWCLFRFDPEIVPISGAPSLSKQHIVTCRYTWRGDSGVTDLLPFRSCN